MIIKLLLSINDKGIISDENEIPWKLKDYNKFIKNRIINYPIIIGSKAYKHYKKTLNNKKILVLSNTLESNDKISVFNDIKSVIDYCKKSKYEIIYLLGGAETIKNFSELSLIDELILCEVECNASGNVSIDLIEDIDLGRFDIYKSEKYSKNNKNSHNFAINYYIPKKKRFF